MPAVLRREMRGKLSAVSRRSAGGSGFPDIPAGTSAGVGPVGGGRAADCAGEHFPRAHGTETSHFSLYLMRRRRSSENGWFLHCVCMGVGYELKVEKTLLGRRSSWYRAHHGGHGRRGGAAVPENPVFFFGTSHFQLVL